MFTFSSTVCSVTLLVVIANSPVTTANPEAKPLELPYTTPTEAVHVLECPAQTSGKASPQDWSDFLTKEATFWQCVKPTGTAVSQLAWIKVGIDHRQDKILHILYCLGNICTVYTSKPEIDSASSLANGKFKEDSDTYCSLRDAFADFCEKDSLSEVVGLAEDMQTIIKNTVRLDPQGLCVDTKSPMNGRKYAQNWAWCSDVYGSILIGNMKHSHVCEEGMKAEVKGIENCKCVNGSFQCHVYNDNQLRSQMCLQNGKQIESVKCGSCKCDVINRWQCPDCPVYPYCGRYSHRHVPWRQMLMLRMLPKYPRMDNQTAMCFG